MLVTTDKYYSLFCMYNLILGGGFNCQFSKRIAVLSPDTNLQSFCQIMCKLDS